MSTGPGPTHKTDGSHDASVDDIADLLVEDESGQTQHDGEQELEDGLDLILETPGPVVAGTFMPPPPAPPEGAPEEGEATETAGSPANLAYDDLLAKLVLPAKAPTPEPEPTPEPVLLEPTTPTPEPQPIAVVPVFPLPAETSRRGSGPNLQLAPPAEERTLVTDNPLVAEEQEAAAREGRALSREPYLAREEVRLAEPVHSAQASAGVRSKLLYLLIGGSLALGGMFLAVLVLKLLIPTPQPTVIVAPPTTPPSPTARVEPLPTTSVPAFPAAPGQPVAAPGKEAPPSAQMTAPESEKAQARSHKPPRAKASRSPTDKLFAGSKPAPQAKPAKAAKSSKAAGWVDPFE